MATISSSMALKMVCVIVACMVVATPFAEGAITCTLVESKMAPCFFYLVGFGLLPRTCCDGVKSLWAAARTTADRQSVCQCLKNVASHNPNIRTDLASSLPGKCGVKIPYKISPSTDCRLVQ